VQFAESGNHRVYLLNSMGQVVSAKNVNGTEVEFRNLPKGRYIVKVK
jgi:arabinan endo-1,5-alpha-L-arabinosidase